MLSARLLERPVQPLQSPSVFLFKHSVKLEGPRHSQDRLLRGVLALRGGMSALLSQALPTDVAAMLGMSSALSFEA